MAKQPDDKPDVPKESKEVGLAPLSKAGRVATWIFGGAFSGGGAAATFLTENQVGTGALLVLGALFLIAAITGRFPSRLQIGESSIDYSLQVLDKVAEIAPADVAAEVIESVAEDGPPQVQQYASHLLGHVELEANVLAGARKAAEVLNRQAGADNRYIAQSSVISSDEAGRRVDAIVRGSKEPLYIECVMLSNKSNIISRLRNDVVKLQSLPGLGLIVTSNQPPLQAMRKFLETKPANVHLLVVANELGNPEALQEKVASEIVRLLSGEGS